MANFGDRSREGQKRKFDADYAENFRADKEYFRGRRTGGKETAEGRKRDGQADAELSGGGKHSRGRKGIYPFGRRSTKSRRGKATPQPKEKTTQTERKGCRIRKREMPKRRKEKHKGGSERSAENNSRRAQNGLKRDGGRAKTGRRKRIPSYRAAGSTREGARASIRSGGAAQNRARGKATPPTEGGNYGRGAKRLPHRKEGNPETKEGEAQRWFGEIRRKQFEKGAERAETGRRRGENGTAQADTELSGGGKHSRGRKGIYPFGRRSTKSRKGKATPQPKEKTTQTERKGCRIGKREMPKRRKEKRKGGSERSAENNSRRAQNGLKRDGGGAKTG